MSARREGREVTLRLLYHLELVGGSPEREIARYWELNPADEEMRRFAETLVPKIYERKEEIDRLISAASDRWSLSRMDTMSRCLLRFAACEILYIPEVPSKVAINEAVELAKKYGPESAASFVNGILDRLLREKAPA